MSWIESHQSLRDHRKTKALKRTLRIKAPQAIGHLHLLWWWCLDNAPSGNLAEVPDVDIAEASEWKGSAAVFVKALTDAGFIDPETRQLHDWCDYAGKFIDQRTLSKEQRKLGGTNRMAKLSPEERTQLATKAALARWRDANKLGEMPSHLAPHLAEMPATVHDRTGPYTTTTTPTPTNMPSHLAPHLAEKDKDFARIVNCFENNLGRVNPIIADHLKIIVDKFSPEWFEAAVAEAVTSGVRNLKYVQKVLDRWTTEGFKTPRKGGQNAKPKGRTRSSDADWGVGVPLT